MKYQIDGFCPISYFNCDPVFVFINAKTKLQQILAADIKEFRDDPYDGDDAVMLRIAESYLKSVNESKTFEDLNKLFDIYPIEE